MALQDENKLSMFNKYDTTDGNYFLFSGWIPVLWGIGEGHHDILVNEDEQGKEKAKTTCA